jgi:hypothetical protein
MLLNFRFLCVARKQFNKKLPYVVTEKIRLIIPEFIQINIIIIEFHRVRETFIFVERSFNPPLLRSLRPM